MSKIKNANDLREKYGGIGVSFTWMGVRKKVNNTQLQEVADMLQADKKALGIQKVLIDTKNKEYKKLTSLRSRIGTEWKEQTLPWIEPGTRLMLKELIEPFQVSVFNPLKEELLVAVQTLANGWQEILDEAPDRLGKLFNENDYPKSPLGLFDVVLNFPNLEPPGYLPAAVLEQQNAKVQKQFEEALKLGEGMLAEELQKLVLNLSEKLMPGEDGKPKTFKAASVEGIYEFFEKIQKLGFGSSMELQNAIDQVKAVMGGVSAPDLKKLGEGTKKAMSEELKKVSESLEFSIQTLPRRKLVVKKKTEEEVPV